MYWNEHFTSLQFHCFRSLHGFQRQGEFPSRAAPPEESWNFKIFPVFSCKRPNSTETHHFEICLHQLSLCKELQCCLGPVVASKRSWQDFKTKSWQDFSRKLTRFQNQRVASRPHGIPQWIGGAHHQVGGGAKISQLLSKTEKDLLQMKFRRRRRRQNSTLPNLLAANRDSRNRRISSYWKQSRGSITFWYIGCIF